MSSHNPTALAASVPTTLALVTVQSSMATTLHSARLLSHVSGLCAVHCGRAGAATNIAHSLGRRALLAAADSRWPYGGLGGWNSNNNGWSGNSQGRGDDDGHHEHEQDDGRRWGNNYPAWQTTGNSWGGGARQWGGTAGNSRGSSGAPQWGGAAAAAGSNSWNSGSGGSSRQGSNHGRGNPQRKGWGSSNHPQSKGWGSGGRWQNNKGDKHSLDAIIGGPWGEYENIRTQPITVNGKAGALAQSMWRHGYARAAAQSLAQAYSSGQADAAAQAMASAATAANSADTTAAAEAVAETTVNHPDVAPGLLAKSADLCVTRGQTDAYADMMTDAFKYARKNKQLPQLASAVSNALATGGTSTKYAIGQAIATAVAGDADSKQAIAEATSTVLCSGDNSKAMAWSQAFAIALSQDSNGCLILNQAKALAQAQCGNSAAQTSTQAEATSTVLGFCGLLDSIPGGVDMGWSGSTGGSSSNSGKR